MPDIDSRGNWMPLTLPQLDFWEEFTFHPDQPVSTVAHYIEIEGEVNEGALQRAIRHTISEAEILSVRFRSGPGNGSPMQACDPGFAPELVSMDLRDRDDPQASALASMEDDLRAKLDLRTDRLSAHRLYRVGNQRYFWYIRAHHIIVDGYGLSLIEQRCAELYNHYRGLSDAGLPFHSLESFLEEESRYQGSRNWQVDRDYWNDYFSNAKDIEVLERGDEEYGGPGLHADRRLPSEFTQGLQATAKAAQVGWPDLLTLVCGLYLYATRSTGISAAAADSQILWLPFMSRWGSVGAHLPALLVNILPFRMRIDRTERLLDCLTRCAVELRQQRRHSRFRIEQISKDRGLAEGSRYFFSPMINVLPFNAPVFSGCRTHRHILGSGPADGFNLTFRSEEDGGDMVLTMDADPAMTGDAEFERHRKALPLFLTRVLKPELLDSPVGRLVYETSSAASLDTVAQRFPI